MQRRRVVDHLEITAQDPRALTVREAHVASLSETLPDLGATEGLPPDWKDRLARECGSRLAGRLPVVGCDAPPAPLSASR